MMKQGYSEEALGRSAVFKCRQHFAQGRDSLDDNERSGWPKAVRIERKIEVHANLAQSVDDIATAVWISHGTRHKILTDDLNMSRISEHCVPRVLT
jgi:hypothetical protein